jgi:hypothetical protein
VKLALRIRDGGFVCALEFPLLKGLRHFDGNAASWKFEEWLMATRQTDTLKESILNENKHRPYESIKSIREHGSFSRRESIFGLLPEEKSEYFRI